MKKFLLLLLLLFIPTIANATTYYIRTDGGTDSQCLGTTDAAYDGSGTGEACAYSHPYYAQRVNGSYTSGLFAGGDTMIISSGEYPMGYGHATTQNGMGSRCDSNGSDCEWKIPGGPDAAHPTRILGKGWDTATGTKPILWGRGNIFRGIIDLWDGVDNIEIQYLEITDHETCRIGFGGVNPRPCTGTDYARVGIYARADTTTFDRVSNVLLKNLNIHGLASAGIMMAGAKDWTFENVTVRANGFNGVEGDTEFSDSVDGQEGTMTVNNMTVSYSGCSETYPGNAVDICVGQAGSDGAGGPYYGGQGDGFVGYGSMADWDITGLKCNYNNADCLDFLHGSGTGYLKIKNSEFIGNTGAAIKSSNALTLENSVIIDDCAMLHYSTYAIKDLTNGSSISSCRADSAISLGGADNKTHSIVNSTLFSNHDQIISLATYSGTCSNLHMILKNSIVYGGREFFQDTTVPGIYKSYGGGPGDGVGDNGLSDTYYSYGNCSVALEEDYNIFYNTKDGALDVSGAHSSYANPGLAGTIKTGPQDTVGYYSTEGEISDFYLAITSTARYEVGGANTADETITCVGDCTVDKNSFSRGANWDTGALEYGSMDTCSDGVLNGDETEIDCGGSCGTCSGGGTGASSGSVIIGIKMTTMVLKSN